MTTETVDPTEIAYAMTLAERMDDAMARQAAAQRMLISCKQTVSQMREKMKTIEAEVVVNGGVGEIVIDGKNAEQRAAQLTAALSRDPSWIDVLETLRAAEREALECETDIDSTANEIRYCRLMLEWGTSMNNRLAGAEAHSRYGGK